MVIFDKNSVDMSHLISPSLLAADFGNLQRDIEMVNRSVADWIHLDIMDGVFVPNISFGFPVLHYINKHAAKPLDVHGLMIICHVFVMQEPIFLPSIMKPRIIFIEP